MLTTLSLLSLLTVAGRAHTPQPAALYYRPRVEVWTNRGDDPYAKGQAVRVSFRAEQDAYVTILRVDTDGRVRVLFPREPWEENFARGGREYEVRGGSDRDAFYVDDYPGVGYIFAVIAADPFVYDAIETGDHWDYRVIADGRVRGDPYVALTDLAQRIVPNGDVDWDTGAPTTTPASASGSSCSTIHTTTRIGTTAARAWCSPGRCGPSRASSSRIAGARAISSHACASGR